MSLQQNWISNGAVDEPANKLINSNGQELNDVRQDCNSKLYNKSKLSFIYGIWVLKTMLFCCCIFA